jgi:nucleoside-diphosphate-sugar epimerase
MAHYLVTGGAGFIGSNLTEQLLKDGHAVRILDNFSTGKRENVPAGAEVIEQDFTDLEAIRPAFQGIDGVFHVGALPRVQVSIEKPIETNHANVTGTLAVLTAARDAKVKRVVYSASSSAYGDATTMPLKEDMPTAPISPYALQKYIGEEYARVFSFLYGMETVSLRYFNVYGKRMADEGAYVTVLAIFLREKKAGNPLPITNDGTQTRDFTHVDDVVRANILAMTSEKVGKGEVINIGAGSNHSVNEVAKLMGGPTSDGGPRIEPHDTLADNSKARELLGWQPTRDFSEAVEELKKLAGVA